MGRSRSYCFSSRRSALGAWAAIDYLWERIDAPTRVALMLGSGIALYGFGWCMDRFAGRAGKGKPEATRGRDHG